MALSKNQKLTLEPLKGLSSREIMQQIFSPGAESLE